MAPSPPTPLPSSSSFSSPSAITAACAAHNLSETEFRALEARAQEAKTRAYCPYSRFRVGAALLTRGGEYVLGANVENASYPVTTCAERVAFGTAVVEGYHKRQDGDEGGEREGGGFKAVAVATDMEGPCSPCGMCRQL
jgi:cytidine deaminase